MSAPAELVKTEWPCVETRDPVEEKYAKRICDALSKTVEGILDAGRALIEAKAELHHGSFEHLVKERCPFSTRTAQTLMKIASHEVLSNPQHVALLPASWGTLAELSRFEPRELKHALKSNWVKADMPRKAVPDLHRRVRGALLISGPRRARRAKPARPISFAQRFRRFVVDQDDLKWLAGLDELAADEVARQIAVKLHALHHEAKITERGVAVVRELQETGKLRKPKQRETAA